MSFENVISMQLGCIIGLLIGVLIFLRELIIKDNRK